MTYEEPIGRFRLLRHDELPDEHKAAMRLSGIDPDDCWSLIWSFETEEAARSMLASEEARKADWQTWRFVDAGPDAPKTITRSAWI